MPSLILLSPDIAILLHMAWDHHSDILSTPNGIAIWCFCVPPSSSLNCYCSMYEMHFSSVYYGLPLSLTCNVNVPSKQPINETTA